MKIKRGLSLSHPLSPNPLSPAYVVKGKDRNKLECVRGLQQLFLELTGLEDKALGGGEAYPGRSTLNQTWTPISLHVYLSYLSVCLGDT